MKKEETVETNKIEWGREVLCVDAAAGACVCVCGPKRKKKNFTKRALLATFDICGRIEDDCVEILD
jgi:hypothetical protein